MNNLRENYKQKQIQVPTQVTGKTVKVNWYREGAPTC